MNRRTNTTKFLLDLWLVTKTQESTWNFPIVRAFYSRGVSTTLYLNLVIY